MRILFFGSSIHSLKIITALTHYNDTYYCSEIIGLVSQPDMPVGRKQIFTPTPVSEYAKSHNLPLYLWENESPQNLLEFVKKLKPDLIIVAYFGQKIPAEVINFPEFGSLNIHPSLLPNYPGSSPAVWAILEGESQTGVTIIKMNEEFDAGEIVAQEKEKINNTDTPEDLYERLFQKGADLLVKILPDYLSGKIKPYPQGPRTSVYARRLTKQDGQIDWSKPSGYLERFIRAMHPWPDAWTEIKINGQTKKLKILKSHISVGAGLVPARGSPSTPALIIDTVQLEGKKPVTLNQLKEGYPDLKLPF